MPPDKRSLSNDSETAVLSSKYARTGHSTHEGDKRALSSENEKEWGLPEKVRRLNRIKRILKLVANRSNKVKSLLTLVADLL